MGGWINECMAGLARPSVDAEELHLDTSVALGGMTPLHRARHKPSTGGIVSLREPRTFMPARPRPTLCDTAATEGNLNGSLRSLLESNFCRREPAV